MGRSLASFGIVALTSLLACDLVEQKLAGFGPEKAAVPESTVTAAVQSAEKPAAEVEFVKRVPKPGTKSVHSRKTSSKFTVNGKTFRETSVLEGEFAVKASDEFRVTKAHLDVKEMYTTSQEGTGTEKKSVSPLAGSSYVVSRDDDGKLSALNSGGDKLPAATLKLIKEEFGSAFEKNRDADFLPERPLKLEEKLMPASDTMLSTLGIKDDGNTLIDGTEFFLRSANESRATFDVSMTMTQKITSARMRVRAKLKGKIDVQPQGAWILGVDLKGPIVILDNKGNEKGSGDLSIVATQTFE